METAQIPVPIDHTTKKYPFDTMEKGAEFEIPLQTERGALQVRSAAGQFKLRNRKPTWKFSVKLYTDNVFRCKRIK